MTCLITGHSIYNTSGLKLCMGAIISGPARVDGSNMNVGAKKLSKNDCRALASYHRTPSCFDFTSPSDSGEFPTYHSCKILRHITA